MSTIPPVPPSPPRPRLLAVALGTILAFGGPTAGASPLEGTGSGFLEPWSDFDHEGAEFGRALAAGDLDADGYDDLAVGAPGAPWDGQPVSGGVQLHFGSPAGFSGPFLLRGEACGAQAMEAEFGAAIAFGDFDGNGSDDLAIGLPGFELEVDGVTRTDVGAVLLLYTFTDPFSMHALACVHPGADPIPGAADEGGRFGSALAVGDFDFDGREDLAIGAPGAIVDGRAGAGAITVLYGTGILNPALAERFDQATPGVAGMPEVGDAFGSSLAVGDFLGGELTGCDLAVGVPGEDFERTDDGVVHVLFGCRPGDGLSTMGSAILDALAPFDGAAFGASLAAGRPAGLPDGQSALFVGAPGFRYFDDDFELVASGAVLAYMGDLSELGPFFLEWHGLHLEGASDEGHAGARIGASVAVGRLPGGREHVLIGAPGWSSPEIDGGRVWDAAAGYDASMPFDLEVSESPAPAGASDRLGAALALGDFGGGTVAAVGLPGRIDPSGRRSGAVWFLRTEPPLFFDGFESGNVSAWSSGG